MKGGWSAEASAGIAVISTEFIDAWQLEGSGSAPQRAFGWATSFPVTSGLVHIRYGAQLQRTMETWLLALLWMVALWVTRKPVAR